MPSAIASLLLLSSLFLPLTHAATTRKCNGYTQLCNRKYSNITFVGSHDSPFVGTDLPDNQQLPLTKQLDLGIRYLQAQTHASPDNDGKSLQLCHSSCSLKNAGRLVTYLGTVKKWLDAHPNEVVTLLLTNGDRLSPGLFDATFRKAGLSSYAYAPPKHPLPFSSWPTLGELLDKKKRLVVFLDYLANESRYPYILDEFAYAFETPFGVTNQDFPGCEIDRPSGASPSGRLYIVNHFLDKELVPGISVPDRSKANRTNAVSGKGSIGAQAALCEKLYKRRPNVVLLDWVESGKPIEAQRVLNSLPASPSSSSSSSSSSTSSSSSAASDSSGGDAPSSSSSANASGGTGSSGSESDAGPASSPTPTSNAAANGNAPPRTFGALRVGGSDAVSVLLAVLLAGVAGALAVL